MRISLARHYDPCVDGVEIAVERQVYSVIEGNEVEVCIVLLSGALMSEIEISANLDNECKFFFLYPLLLYTLPI